MNITTEDFFKYLESLGLFRFRIEETPDGFEATISSLTVPNLKNFTQVNQNKDGTWWVRLSKADIFNKEITNDFFKK